MHCLYIDLASNKGLLALVTEQSVIAAEHMDQRIEDSELMPLLERLMADGEWRMADLTHIACVVGPGGFMSLRVGVALSNTLADQLNIPIAGIHLSDVYKARWQTEESRLQNVLWLHSTKKTELFVRGFGDAAKMWPEAIHMTLEDFSQSAAGLQACGWTGELIPEHREVIEQLGMQERTLPSPEDVLPGFLAGQTYKKQILEPWYGRGW